MSQSQKIHVNGDFGNAIDMALFLILVSVILAVFWYIIFFVIGLLFGASKKEGLSAWGRQAPPDGVAYGRTRYNNVDAQGSN